LHLNDGHHHETKTQWINSTKKDLIEMSLSKTSLVEMYLYNAPFSMMMIINDFLTNLETTDLKNEYVDVCL
jgi:hypothetical protein